MKCNVKESANTRESVREQGSQTLILSPTVGSRSRVLCMYNVVHTQRPVYVQRCTYTWVSVTLTWVVHSVFIFAEIWGRDVQLNKKFTNP